MLREFFYIVVLCKVYFDGYIHLSLLKFSRSLIFTLLYLKILLLFGRVLKLTFELQKHGLKRQVLTLKYTGVKNRVI